MMEDLEFYLGEPVKIRFPLNGINQIAIMAAAMRQNISMNTDGEKWIEFQCRNPRTLFIFGMRYATMLRISHELDKKDRENRTDQPTG